MPIDIEEATRQADDLLQGAIGQFSKPLIVPTSAPVDTTRATETLNRAEVTGGEDAQTVNEMQKLLTSATQEEKVAIGKEGEAKAAKATAEGARSQEEAAGYKYYQRLFGMDISPDSEIAAAAARQKELRAGMEAKLDRVNKLKSVSLFDNPIDYLLNSFELPGATEDYNIQVTKVNNLQQAIDDGIASAKNAGDLNNRGIPTITASMAAANANIALAEAAKEKARRDENLATVSVDFASKKLTADIALAHATRETTQLEQANERLKYETLINAVRLADSHGARLESAAKLLYELADKAGLDVILKQYDRNVGNPPNTTNRQSFTRMPAAERENITAIGAGSAGTNPYEFLKNFKHVGPQLSPETGRLLDFVQNAEAKILRNPSLEPKVQEQRIAKQLKEDVEKEMRRPSQSKVFVEMSPAKMIASNAVPQGSEMAKILEPLANTEGSITTDSVVETIAKNFKNPTEAGVAISQYYQANMALRNKSLNMSLMNMTPPTSYVVPLRRRIFGYTYGETYDLTKPGEATKYLIATQIQSKALRDQETGNWVMPIGFEENKQTPEGSVSDTNPPARGTIFPRVPGTADRIPQPKEGVTQDNIPIVPRPDNLPRRANT